MARIETIAQKAFIFLLSFGLLAEETDSPWLTGPLIAPVGTAIPCGEMLFKTYLFLGTEKGVDNHRWELTSSQEHLYSLSVQGFYFLGLTPWCDFNIVPRFFYQRAGNEQSANCGDLTIALDFQLLSADQTPYFPGIKLAVREIFPTGNFQRMQPRKLPADWTGNGIFATQLDLVLYKVFHMYKRCWLSLTISAEYTMNSSVNVLGFNAYGGGFGARGKVLPGNIFEGMVSFELTLNKNWVFALDNIYTYQDASIFYGREGISLRGALAPVGTPCSSHLSFAPAIEYNFNSHFGIIAGCYFSALSKNSPIFRRGAVNFNYRY